MKIMHILMYPWFAIGHFSSFLHLANKLADKGHKISFFIPKQSQQKLHPHNHYPDLITFFPVTVPHVEGLPTGAETTNDVPAPAVPLLMTAMDLTMDTMVAQLAHLKPDLVFYDFAYWLPELARQRGAKSVFYALSNLSCLVPIVDGIFRQRVGGDDTNPFPEMSVKVGSLVRLGKVEFGDGMTLGQRMAIALRECDALASKTSWEMEGKYIEFIEKHMAKPVLLAGPVIPEPPNSILDESINEWLSGFSNGSVVYCAFGSECVLTKELFQELLLGIELTGSPFLVALKPPIGYETIESGFPEGFMERTKERGLVHGGWVQQPLILQHPSVGCFVTHCGQGSLAEGIWSDCQLVLLPRAFEQFRIARLMSIDLKIGVEVKMNGDDSFFTKEGICEAIFAVMNEGDPKGDEVRANHAKWRQLLMKEGLEGIYIENFERSLQQLIG